MNTVVLKVDTRIAAQKIAQAAAFIRAGELVAFPTETVYGLGANALDPDAVRKIFTAKHRPADNPLIVHVASEAEVKTVAARIPKTAQRLMDAFWPGPLAIVLPRKKNVAAATAGLDTVVVRMPDNPVALALIAAAQVPIAAPSANTSGRPSPTRAQHVLTDLRGKIACVLDGGPCAVGVESTVVDVRTKPVTVLRVGGITIEQLEAVVGNVQLRTHATDRVASPGTKYKHYAPKAKLVLVEGAPTAVQRKVRELKQHYLKQGKTVTVLKKAELSPHELYNTLRTRDTVQILLAGSVPETGNGVAVMDRLRRAASRIIRV
jgi:L-threonylcarbamoyladenylate synthase